MEKTFDGFINHLPVSEKKMVLKLQKIIFSNIPNCKEKISYNVPFYFLNKRICFIWPATIPWGSVKNGVAFGFCYANMLSNHYGVIEMGGRKQVGIIQYVNETEIDEKKLKIIIAEAVLVDEMISKKIKVK